MMRLCIVGGGAAGLCAALGALREARRQGIPLSVTLCEADEKLGRSILRTGNGRCNYGNLDPDPGLYHSSDFVAVVFRSFLAHSDGLLGELEPLPLLTDSNRVCEVESVCDGDPLNSLGPAMSHALRKFFTNLGLWDRLESGGRLYPLANKAQVVRAVLLEALGEFDYTQRCNSEVVALRPPSSPAKPWTLTLADGELLRADSVILSCGGTISDALVPPAVDYEEPRPVLGPVACKGKRLRSLDGIRVRCEVTLERKGVPLHQEKGEVQFRRYGLSGICIFNLSRFAEPQDYLVLDLAPHLDQADLEHWLQERYHALCDGGLSEEAAAGNRVVTYDALLRGMLLEDVAGALLETLRLKREEPVDPVQLPLVAKRLKSFGFEVVGIGDEALCQVHRGGCAVESFDPETLACINAPGLYGAGEALDVDAPCGGYNLHWAWISGFLAGANAVVRGVKEAGCNDA